MTLEGWTYTDNTTNAMRRSELYCMQCNTIVRSAATKGPTGPILIGVSGWDQTHIKSGVRQDHRRDYILFYTWRQHGFT